jgi:hypothetical protein
MDLACRRRQVRVSLSLLVAVANTVRATSIEYLVYGHDLLPVLTRG